MFQGQAKLTCNELVDGFDSLCFHMKKINLAKAKSVTPEEEVLDGRKLYLPEKGEYFLMCNRLPMLVSVWKGNYGKGRAHLRWTGETYRPEMYTTAPFVIKPRSILRVVRVRTYNGVITLGFSLVYSPDEDQAQYKGILTFDWNNSRPDIALRKVTVSEVRERCAQWKVVKARKAKERRAIERNNKVR